jgi:hypothetical protein
VRPGEPCCPPARRPDFFRNDRGGGLANPSDDGGFDEFREVSPNRRSNSPTRTVNVSITAACVTTNARSSSTDNPSIGGNPDTGRSHHNHPPLSINHADHLNSYEL